MQSKRVSVIIPCYNAGVYLNDAIESVLQSSYKDIEIILVDDGSDDTLTVEIISKYQNKEGINLINQANAGPSVARNNAVKASKGEYLVFLDADDKIHKDTINLCCATMNSDDRIGVVYGNYKCFGEKNEIHKQREFDKIKMLRANEIALCSMVRKKAFLDVSGFDEYLSRKGLEDWDLWLSLYENGWQFKHLNELMFDVRVHKSSRTFAVANLQIDDLLEYIYKKHSALLSKTFLELYHENKNIKSTSAYKLAIILSTPFKIIKKIFCKPRLPL